MIHHSTIIALTLLLTSSLPAETTTQPATQPVKEKEGPASRPGDTTNATVTGTGLYVRTSPSAKEGAVCDKVDKPLRITVVGWDEKYWKILPTPGCRCFISRRFVRPDNKEEIGTVLGNSVCVRVGRGGKAGKVVARANRGDNVRILAESGDYYVIAPPKGIRFYVSTTFIKGDPPTRKPPSPVGLIPQGPTTPKQLVARIIKAMGNSDQNLFVSCFDLATRASLPVEKVFQHSRAIQNLRNRAVEVFGKEARNQVPDGITTMLGIDISWFSQAKIVRNGDKAKVVWKKTGPDRSSETKIGHLARQDGRWYFFAPDAPTSRIKRMGMAAMLANATWILDDARKRLSDKEMTPEKINKYINKKTWEAMKRGDFLVSQASSVKTVTKPGDKAEGTTWSQTVNGLQARITLKRTAVSNGTPIISTYLELRNVSNRATPMKIAWASEKMKFRVIDANGRKLPTAMGPYSGRAFSKQNLVIPNRGTLSFDISIPGLGIPGDQAGLIGLGPTNSWVFKHKEKDYYLRAVLEIPKDKHNEDDRNWWHGRIEMPPVRVPLKPEPVDPAKLGEMIRQLGGKMLATNSAVSEEAVRALSLIDDERVIPWYLKAMDTNRYGLKFAALDRLSRFNSDEALRGLKKGMTTRGADIGNCTTDAVAAQAAGGIRHSAACALARSPHPGAMKLLLSMRNDPSRAVRITVLHMLGRMDSAESLMLLKKMSKDPDKGVRKEALRYLKLRETKPAATKKPGAAHHLPLLKLDDSAKGKTVSAFVGQEIHAILKVNSPPAHYYAAGLEVEGDAIELKGVLEMATGPDGSWHTFALRAKKPGTARLMLKYKPVPKKKHLPIITKPFCRIVVKLATQAALTSHTPELIELGRFEGQIRWANMPLLSANGKHVAFIEKTAGGKRMVQDGKPHSEYDEIGLTPWPKFSPDGTRLAYAARKGNQWFIVVNGKPDTPYDSVGTKAFSMLDFSPNGKHLWYRATKGADRFIVLNGRRGPSYTGLHFGPLVGPDGSVYYAINTESNTKGLLIVNGKVAGEYDGIASLEPSPRSADKYLSYRIKRGQKWFPVIDGKEQDSCNIVGRPIYSSDGKHFAYVGADRGWKFVVVDGRRRGEVFENVLQKTVGFLDTGEVYYLAGGKHNGSKKFLIVGNKRVLEFYWTKTLPNGACIVNLDPPQIGKSTGFRLRVIYRGKVGDVFGSVGAPVCTDDGRHLAYAAWKDRGRKAYLVVDGKAQLKDVDGWELHVDGFLADGRLVYHVRKGGVGTVFMGQTQAPGFSRNLRFTKDRKHVIWVNKVGDEEVLMIDGVPGPKFPTVRDWEDPKISPSGRYAAYPVNLSKHKIENGYVLVSGDRIIAKGVVCNVDFSPVGDRLAYAIVTLEGKRRVFVDERMVGEYDEVRWNRGYTGQVFFAPNGRHYAFKARKGTKHVMVVNGVEGPQFDQIVTTNSIEYPPVVGLDNVVYFGIRNGKLHRVVHPTTKPATQPSQLVRKLLQKARAKDKTVRRTAAADLTVLLMKQYGAWPEPSARLHSWGLHMDQDMMRLEVRTTGPEDQDLANMAAHCMSRLPVGMWRKPPVDRRDPIEREIIRLVNQSDDPAVQVILLVGLGCSDTKPARDCVVAATAHLRLGVRHGAVFLVQGASCLQLPPPGVIHIGSSPKRIDQVAKAIRSIYKLDKTVGAGWGALIDGLQTRLTADTTKAPAGQPVTVRLEVRNISDKPIDVANAEGLVKLVEIYHLTEQIVSESFGALRRSKTSSRLGPGETRVAWSKKFNESKPGKYRLSWPEVDGWNWHSKGRIPPRSNVLVLTLMAPLSAHATAKPAAGRDVSIIKRIELVDKDGQQPGLYCGVPVYDNTDRLGVWSIYEGTKAAHLRKVDYRHLFPELVARLAGVYSTRGSLEVAQQVLRDKTITIRLRYINEEKDIWSSPMVGVASRNKKPKSVYLWGKLPKNLPQGKYTVKVELDEYIREGKRLVPAPKDKIRHTERLTCTFTVPAPAKKPATKPGGNGGNPRISRHENKIRLRWDATDDDLLQLGDGKGIVALHYGGWPSGGPLPRITDKGLANLEGWKSLKELVFIPATTNNWGREIPHITDEGLKHLAGLKTLEKLVLYDQKITDAGLAHLSGLVNMKELHLDFIPLTDAGLKHLRGMKHLKVLRFHNARLTDAGLENLKGMADMEDLQLGRARITDKGLAIIARMKKLHTLDLQGNLITDKGLKNLAGLSRLKWLALNDTGVTDAGLEHLKNLKRLEWLYLEGTKITGTGLRHLKDLSKLRVLYLSKTGTGDAGLESLAALTGLERLKLNHTGITDEGLIKLTAIKNLKELEVRQTSVTQTGIERFKKAMTKVRVVGGGKTDSRRTAPQKPTTKPAKTDDARVREQLIQLVARSLPKKWQFAGQEEGFLAPACWVSGKGIRLVWRHRQINPLGDWKKGPIGWAGLVHLWIMDAGYSPKEEKYAHEKLRTSMIAPAKEIAIWRGRRVFLWGGRGTDWPTMQTDILTALKATDAPTPKPGGLVAEFPCGVRAELVAVSEHVHPKPKKDRKWWQPDGTSMKTGLYDYMDNGWASHDGQKVREFAFRITGVKGRDIGLRQSVPKFIIMGADLPHPVRAHEKVKSLKVLCVTYKSDVKATDIRLGVASGEWKTRTWKNGAGTSSMSDSAMLGKPIESDGGIYISASDSVAQEQRRIIAIDKTGKMHLAKGTGDGGSVGNLRMTTVRFDNLTLKNTDKIYFQSRPYKWITFKNVSLQPGHKTKTTVQPTSKSPDRKSPVTKPENLEGRLATRAAEIMYLKRQIAEARLDETLARAALEDLKKQIDFGKVGEHPQVVMFLNMDFSLRALRNKEAGLSVKHKNALQKFGPRHRQVMEIKKDLNKVQGQVAARKKVVLERNTILLLQAHKVQLANATAKLRDLQNRHDKLVKPPATKPGADSAAIVADAFRRIHKRVAALKGPYPVLEGIADAKPQFSEDSGFGFANRGARWEFANNATKWGKGATPSAVDSSKPFCRIILNMWNRSGPAVGSQPVAGQRTYQVGGVAWKGYLMVWSDSARLIKAVKTIVEEELTRATTRLSEVFACNAIASKPRDFRSGQNPTGLDLTLILKLTGQKKDFENFTKNHRFLERDTKKLVAEKKVWALCALLDHPNVDAKIHAARGLVKLADPASAAVLLAAAKSNNYPVGGSENATLHSNYRRTLKQGLEKITGLSLTPSGLKVVTYPKPGKPRVIRSEDDPSYFKEHVDFKKVENWLRQTFLASGHPLATKVLSGSDWANDDKATLPGHETLLKDTFKGNVVLVAVCQARKPAFAQLGYSGVIHAHQEFRLVNVLYGEATNGQRIKIRYSYLDWSNPPDRQIRSGETVIWIVRYNGVCGETGVKALADTPANRKAVKGLVAGIPPSVRERVAYLKALARSTARVTKAFAGGWRLSMWSGFEPAPTRWEKGAGWEYVWWGEGYTAKERKIGKGGEVHLWIMEPDYLAKKPANADAGQIPAAEEIGRWRGRRVFLWGAAPKWPTMKKDIMAALNADDAPAKKPAMQPGDRWKKVAVSFDGHTANVEVQRFDPPLRIKPVKLSKTSRATPMDAAISMVSWSTFGKDREDFRRYADHMLDPKGFLDLRAKLKPERFFEVMRKDMESGVHVLALIRYAGGVLVVNWTPSMWSVPTGNGAHVGAWHMVERKGLWCLDNTGKHSSPLTQHLAKTGYTLVREAETPGIKDFRELSKVLDAAKPKQVWWTVAYAPSSPRLASPKGYAGANDSMEFHFIPRGQTDIHKPGAILWVMKPGYEAVPVPGTDQRADKLSITWRGRRVFLWGKLPKWTGMLADIHAILIATDAPSGTGGLDAMFANLKSKDAFVRFRTARVLGLMGNEAAVLPLIAALNDARGSVRANVAKALGRLRDPRAIDPLIAMLHDDKAGYSAAEALGNLGYRRASGPLMEVISSAKGYTMLEAVWALGKLADPKSIPFLVKILRDPKSDCRRQAARALALAGDIGFQQLMVLLDDKDATIRRLAAQALGTTGVTGVLAIRKLESVAKQDQDLKVKKAATLAVKQIRKNFKPTTSQPVTQAEWGEAVKGLRCRWVLPTKPAVVGTEPTVSLEVENVSGKPLLWECRSGITWRLRVPPKYGTRVKFRIRSGTGVRPATAAEVRREFKVERNDLKDDDPYEGFYRLAPGARLTLTCKLQRKFTEFASYLVEGGLCRHNPRLSGKGGPLMVSCPALALNTAARLQLVLRKGSLLRNVWYNERYLAREKKGGDPRTPQERKKHADAAKKTFDQTVAAFKEVRASDPRFGLAAEGVFQLSTLYEWAQMHDECIRTCEELLNKYPNARLPGVVGKRHQFDTYHRLGDAYAGLGHREKATGAHMQSLLSAESIRSWHVGMNRLLQYEMQTKKRAKLPKELQAKLDKARKDTPVLISLTLDAPVKKSDGPVRLNYKIHNRTGKPIRDFRLVFRLLFNNVSGATADALYDRRLGQSDEIVVPAGKIVKGTATVWIDHAWLTGSSVVLARMEHVVKRADGIIEGLPPEWTKPYWSDPLWLSSEGSPAAKPVKMPAEKDTAEAGKLVPVPGPVSISLTLDAPVKKLSGPIRLNYRIRNRTRKTLRGFQLVFYQQVAGYGQVQQIPDFLSDKDRYRYSDLGIGRIDDIVVPAGQVVKGTATIRLNREWRGKSQSHVVLAKMTGYVVQQANGTSRSGPSVQTEIYSSNPLSLSGKKSSTTKSASTPAGRRTNVVYPTVEDAAIGAWEFKADSPFDHHPGPGSNPFDRAATLKLLKLKAEKIKVDLNGDKVDEVLIANGRYVNKAGKETSYDGAQNRSWAVLQKIGGGWRVVGSGWGSPCPPRVLAKTTKGWKNLVSGHHLSAGSGASHLYQFNGKQYTLTRQTEYGHRKIHPNMEPGGRKKVFLVPLGDGVLRVENVVEEGGDIVAGTKWTFVPAGKKKPVIIGRNLCVMGEAYQVLASRDGKHLAVNSVGEGHPVVQILDLPMLLAKRKVKNLAVIDPYPGYIRLEGWEKGRLIVSSDMLLTHRSGENNRVPAFLEFSKMQRFSVDPATGKIAALTPAAKDPVTYYRRNLDNKDGGVLENALMALVHLRATVAIPQIQQRIAREKNPDFKSALQDALKKLTQPAAAFAKVFEKLLADQAGASWKTFEAFLAKTKDKPAVRKALADALVKRALDGSVVGLQSATRQYLHMRHYLHDTWYINMLKAMSARKHLRELLGPNRRYKSAFELGCCVGPALVDALAEQGQIEDARLLVKHIQGRHIDGQAAVVHEALCKLTKAKLERPDIPSSGPTTEQLSDARDRATVAMWNVYLTNRRYRQMKLAMPEIVRRVRGLEKDFSVLKGIFASRLRTGRNSGGNDTITVHTALDFRRNVKFPPKAMGPMSIDGSKPYCALQVDLYERYQGGKKIKPSKRQENMTFGLSTWIFTGDSKLKKAFDRIVKEEMAKADSAVAQPAAKLTTKPAAKWMVTPNPVEAIKAVLPKGFVIQKVVKNAHPFYLEPGKGKAIWILNKNAKGEKMTGSVALWIMPADYQGRPAETDTTQQMETPRLIKSAKNARLYGWGCRGELRKKILKALLVNAKAPAAKPVVRDYARRIEAILPKGWYVEIEKDIVTVSRKKSVEMDYRNMPCRDAARRDPGPMTKTEEKAYLMAKGDIRSMIYSIEIRFAPPISKAGVARLKQENQKTRGRYYRKHPIDPNRKPSGPPAELTGALHPIPDILGDKCSMFLSLPIEGRRYALYEKADHAECRKVDQAVLKMLKGDNATATKPAVDLLKMEPVLKDIGLVIREQAATLQKLTAKVKPDFTFGDSGRDMMWVGQDEKGNPQFTLDRAYVHKPKGKPAKWVLLTSRNAPLRLIRGGCEYLHGVAKLHKKVPTNRSCVKYAIVKSTDPKSGTVYEIVWQSTMSGGTSLAESKRHLFVLRDGEGRWRFIGEGLSGGHGKMGYCNSWSSAVDARVEWTKRADTPVRIHFVITDAEYEWASSDMLQADPTAGDAMRDELKKRLDWVLDGKLPATLRKVTGRPYILARPGDTFNKVVRHLSSWSSGWRGNLDKDDRKIEAVWKRELVRLNPKLPTGNIPKGTRINLLTHVERIGLFNSRGPATKPAKNAEAIYGTTAYLKVAPPKMPENVTREAAIKAIEKQKQSVAEFIISDEVLNKAARDIYEKRYGPNHRIIRDEARKFRDVVEVLLLPETRLVRISIFGSDGQKITRIANAIADAAIKQYKDPPGSLSIRARATVPTQPISKAGRFRLQAREIEKGILTYVKVLQASPATQPATKPTTAPAYPGAGSERRLKVLIEQLQDSAYSRRAGALRELEGMAQSARLAIPLLGGMFINENSDLSEKAGDLLKRFGPARPEDVPGLIWWLKHKDRSAVAMAIGRLGDLGPHAKPAIPALVEKLNQWRDNDDRVQAEAASALGKIGPEGVDAALACIRPALKNENQRVRYLAVDALHSMGKAAKAAMPDLQAALTDQSKIVRAEAAQVLGEWGPEAVSASSGLVSLLRDKSPDVRQKAAKALVRMGKLPKKVVKELPQLLAGQDKTVQLCIAIALANSGQNNPWIDRIVQATRKKYESSDFTAYEVHMLAVRALGNIGTVDERVVRALIASLGTEKRWIRMRAAESLALCGAGAKDAVGPLIKAAMEDEEINVRQQAAYAIGCIGLPNEQAIVAMRKMANGKPSPLTAAAGFALVRMGKTDEGLSAILQVLRSDYADWRVGAAELLGKIDPPARSVGPLLKQAARRATTLSQRRRIQAVALRVRSAPFGKRAAMTEAEVRAEIAGRDVDTQWHKEGPPNSLRLGLFKRVGLKGKAPSVLITRHSDQAAPGEQSSTEVLRFYKIVGDLYLPVDELARKDVGLKPEFFEHDGQQFVKVYLDQKGGGPTYIWWLDGETAKTLPSEDPKSVLSSLLKKGERFSGKRGPYLKASHGVGEKNESEFRSWHSVFRPNARDHVKKIARIVATYRLEKDASDRPVRFVVKEARRQETLRTPSPRELEVLCKQIEKHGPYGRSGELFRRTDWSRISVEWKNRITEAMTVRPKRLGKNVDVSLAFALHYLDDEFVFDTLSRLAGSDSARARCLVGKFIPYREPYADRATALLERLLPEPVSADGFDVGLAAFDTLAKIETRRARQMSIRYFLTRVEPRLNHHSFRQYAQQGLWAFLKRREGAVSVPWLVRQAKSENPDSARWAGWELSRFAGSHPELRATRYRAMDDPAGWFKANEKTIRQWIAQAKKFARKMDPPHKPKATESGQPATQPVRFAQLIQAMKTHRSSTSRLQDAQAKLVKMGPSVVPILINMLCDDPKVSDMPTWIAEVLGKIGDRRATKPLIAFMESNSRYRGRVKSAEALGTLGDARAVPALIRQLGKGRPNYIQEAAAKSLGQLGARSAVAPLIEQLRRNKYYRVRMAAAEALGVLRAKEAIGPLIDEIRLRKGRRFSFKKYEKYGDGQVPEKVQAELTKDIWLDDQDRYCRSAAGKALVRIGPASVSAIIAALDEKNSSFNWMLVRTLAKIQGEGVSDALLDALKLPSAGVRAGAARALGLRRERAAIKPMVKLLNDPDDFVKVQAALALGRLKDTRSLPALLDIVKNPSFPLRVETAEVLGGLGDPKAAAALTEAMRLPTPRPWVGVGTLARVIGKLSDRSVVPALVEHLQDTKLPNRRYAAMALGLLKARPAVSALVASLHDAEQGIKADSTTALGLIGDAKAVPALIELLGLSGEDDPFRWVRTEAVKSLAAIGDVRAIRPLKELLDGHLSRKPSGLSCMRPSANDILDAQFSNAIREALKHLKSLNPTTQPAGAPTSRPATKPIGICP